MAAQRTRKNVKAIRKPTKVAAKTAQRGQRVSRTAAAPATRTNGMLDYEGARQVLSRYCFALDRGQLSELAALFHREATFSVSFQSDQKVTGRDSIHAWYERFFQQRPGQFRYMRHKIYEPMIVVNGNTATTSTYFDADSIEAGDNIRVVAGRYDDVLVKEQGQWYFKERTIHVFYHYSPGQGHEGMA